ncbi:MAG TPA: DNA-binding response regulator [Ruminococcaceae bacterium]|nr:DNA-binding response regulator [Oscillospiraceae bacterium]
MYRIFVIEDDNGIAQAIREQTQMWGYETVCAENFREIMAEFAAVQPHLIIMDISLPFFDGYHWCREIRKLSSVPIIFISSAADNMNIIMAINMGGDDFIAKPFDQSVLIAKIQALLRRTYAFGEAANIIEHRGALLNTDDNTMTCNGEKIELSKNEYRILLTLLRNKGKTVSREKLMEELWESDTFVDENALSVNVSRLRKKLEDAGLNGYIITKFGLGYLVED